MNERQAENLQQLLTLAPEYDGLRRRVERDGFFWGFLPSQVDEGGWGEHLSVASRQLPDGRGHTGCSFRVARRQGRWYVLTWSPHIYRLPAGAEPDELCVAFLRATDRTPYDIPATLKAEFALEEISDDEFDVIDAA